LKPILRSHKEFYVSSIAVTTRSYAGDRPDFNSSLLGSPVKLQGTTAKGVLKVVSGLNVPQMSSMERWRFMIEKAARDTPGEAGRVLWSLREPKNLALIAGGAAVVGALNLTGFGTAATILTVFGGVIATGTAGLKAVYELQQAISVLSQARVERDLNIAASHLSKAVVAAGSAAIIGLLTRKAWVSSKAPASTKTPKTAQDLVNPPAPPATLAPSAAWSSVANYVQQLTPTQRASMIQRLSMYGYKPETVVYFTVKNPNYHTFPTGGLRIRVAPSDLQYLRTIPNEATELGPSGGTLVGVKIGELMKQGGIVKPSSTQYGDKAVQVTFPNNSDPLYVPVVGP
jgi:hypothetical protein